ATTEERREGEVMTAESTNASGWEPPVPFGDCDLPPFPVHILPSWLRAWAEAEAEAMQTPVDLPALLGLAVVALALAKRVEVQVRRGCGEPLNLYVVISLPPGEGKSPVFKDATAPVHAYERERAAAMAPIIAEAHERRTLAEERLKALHREASNAKSAEKR